MRWLCFCFLYTSFVVIIDRMIQWNVQTDSEKSTTITSNRETRQTWSFKENKSRNKIVVNESAARSLWKDALAKRKKFFRFQTFEILTTRIFYLVVRLALLWRRARRESRRAQSSSKTRWICFVKMTFETICRMHKTFNNESFDFDIDEERSEMR